MDRALALAKFEFMSNFNIKGDAISFSIIAIVLFLRVWTVEVIQDKTPINVGILLQDQLQAENLRLSSEEQLKTLVQGNSEAQLQSMLEKEELDAYIVQCSDCETLTLNVVSIDEVDAKNHVMLLAKLLSDALIPLQFSLDPEVYKQIQSGFEIKYINNGEQDLSNSRILTTVFMFLVCISVLSAFSLLLQGITSEKEEKITEMYMSSMKVQEWVDGKVIAALGIAVKGLVLYFFFTAIALDVFGFTSFSNQELLVFAREKAFPLFVSFTLGFVFWCYLYAFVSVLIDKSSTSIKNAAILFPMAAFGVIYSISDYVASPFYHVFSFFPMTYIFALPSKIMSSDFQVYYLVATSVVQILATILMRQFTYKHLKFI
ncbi:ABC transporter permease [Alteromonas halophila]|uniref:ABC-2 type transporter transmembrane domain-containing protein n=1 Tax=Alteromonas halophila TaxID=516698 RepID=A0A918JJT0_9ALTE|nr:ABC transporter permease [Alteromonas halophila]GGW83893.1 hypothetical protein GCM10007391_16880 [Alteromonas halophila]